MRTNLLREIMKGIRYKVIIFILVSSWVLLYHRKFIEKLAGLILEED